jgi:hypothetical protein
MITMSSKALIALAVVTQTCCCCINLLGGPQPPYAITYSDETIQRLQERLDEVQTDANGEFSFAISETEMTALAAQALDEMDDGPPISDPQVFFRDGRVELYMTIHLDDSFSLPGMIAFTVDVQAGDLAITIEEMIAGPLPLPGSTTEATTEALDDALTEGVSDAGGDVSITDIQVSDGEMIIYGQVQR